MAEPITAFNGQYRFLSDFYPVEVLLDGVRYPTVEHAYVAAKSLDPAHRQAVLKCQKPGDAKRLGRKVTLRPDWDDVKLDIMENLLRQKFNSDPLRSLLRQTSDAELIEGNSWGDTFWGMCGGEGFNHLGRLLMKIRAELALGPNTPPKPCI